MKKTNRVICPFCKNDRFIKEGYTNLTWKEQIDRYFSCDNCNKKWVSIYKIQDTKEVII